MSTSRPFPVIGLPARTIAGSEDRPSRFGINSAYVRALERAGGVPLLIPPLDDEEGLHVIYARVDGIVFPGGDDVAPSQYREEPITDLNTVDQLQDRVELTLGRWALHDDLPTLGICRGQQLLNVASGGTLYQDLRYQGATSVDHSRQDGRSRDALVHAVRLEPGSRLAQLLDETLLDVNSSHHQAVKEIAPRFRVVGRSPDGVIEAIESPDRRFLIAVQWHPEELEHLLWARRLFEGLVQAARRNRV